MTISLFKNGKGVIHGDDPRRICCSVPGVLKIGRAEITISGEEKEILPSLFHGATGNYDATFTDTRGKTFVLEKVSVRGGRILPPSPTTVEIMELNVRADKAEDERDALKAKVAELEKIFDTDALNFLIK